MKMKSYQKPIKKYCKEHRFAKELFKKYKIKYVINWSHRKLGVLGVAMPPNKVTIYTHVADYVIHGKNGRDRIHMRRATKQEFLSTIFHEIQHIRMYRNKQFLTYHLGLKRRSPYWKFLKWSKEHLIAERTADKMAIDMMQEYYPRIPFDSYYFKRIGYEGVKRTILHIALNYHPKKIKYLIRSMGY